MPRSTAAALIPLTLALAALVGCQTTPPPLGEPPPAADAAAAPAVQPTMEKFVGDVRPPTKRIEPTALAAIRSQKKTFAIVGLSDTFTQTITDQPNAGPPRHVIDLDGEHRQHVITTDAGPQIDAIENLRFDKLTRFDTPQPIIPADLTPGGSVTFSTPVTIYDLDDPTEATGSGTSTTRFTHDADVTLELPAGRYDAVRLRIDYRGEFPPVKAWSKTWLYYAVSVGLVASVTDEHAVIMGLIPVHTERTMVLESID